ncbi:MAG: hypothetical protein ACOX8W_06605 [bacterium]|jgi:uncharacterized coiled-coil protein SlyX
MTMEQRVAELEKRVAELEVQVKELQAQQNFDAKEIAKKIEETVDHYFNRSSK